MLTISPKLIHLSAIQKELDQSIDPINDNAELTYNIAGRMQVQIRSLDQENYNPQNSSSMLKVAEEDVSNTTEILRTLKEKAINAANDNNTDIDRAAISKELNASVQQIDDNALLTFNGKFLDYGVPTYQEYPAHKLFQRTEAHKMNEITLDSLHSTLKEFNPNFVLIGDLKNIDKDIDKNGDSQASVNDVVLNWDSFNVDADEIVSFRDNSASNSELVGFKLTDIAGKDVINENSANEQVAGFITLDVVNHNDSNYNTAIKTLHVPYYNNIELIGSSGTGTVYTMEGGTQTLDA